MSSLDVLDNKYQVLNENEMYDVEGGCCCILLCGGALCVGAVVIAGGCCCVGALGLYCYKKSQAQ